MYRVTCSVVKALTVVLSPEAYEELTRGKRKARVAGTAANLLRGTDVAALLSTDIGDDFSEYLKT